MSVARPPTHLASDYVELAVLVVLTAIGAPVNLAAYVHIRERSTHSRLDLLKKHLNATDLLVMFIFCPSKALWVITYDWRGGDAVCRLVKFAHALTFQSCSNVIVVIALDRLLSVVRRSAGRDDAVRRTRHMLAAAWAAAAVVAAPQLVFWQAFEPFDGWFQCVDVWQVRRVRQSIAHMLSNGTVPKPQAFAIEERIYTVVHLTLVFWFPCALIAVSYITVVVWVTRNASNGSQATPASRRRTTKNRSTSAAAKKSWSTSSVSRPTPPDIIVTEPATSTSRWREQALEVKFQSCVGSRQTQAIRVSLLLVVAYVVCWLPYNVLALRRVISASSDSSAADYYWLYNIVVLNSVINPFLYGMVGRV